MCRFLWKFVQKLRGKNWPKNFLAKIDIHAIDSCWSGVNVMITIFGNFRSVSATYIGIVFFKKFKNYQYSEQKTNFFLKTFVAKIHSNNIGPTFRTITFNALRFAIDLHTCRWVQTDAIIINCIPTNITLRTETEVKMLFVDFRIASSKTVSG
jgi:hypothetical protein